MLRVRFTYLLFVSVFFISCSNNDVIDNRPVTKGVFVTGETSPDAIAVWGTPESPNSPMSTTDGYEMRNIYPNPSNGAMRIEFDLPIDTKVSIWAERARWENEEEVEYIEPRVATIIDLILPQGSHLVRWDNGFNCGGIEGRNLEEGFYRVYVKSDEFYFWKDIYITGFLENAPPGLERFNTEEFCN